MATGYDQRERTAGRLPAIDRRLSRRRPSAATACRRPNSTPWLDRLAPALARLQDDYRTRRLPHLRIAEETSRHRGRRGRFRQAVPGRAGGDLLRHRRLEPRRPDAGPARRLAHPRHRPMRRRSGGRARASTTISTATRCSSALGSFDDLGGVRFVVISKSGGTPETLVQALAALDAVKAAGLEKRIPELFLGVSEPAVAGKSNGLRTLFEAHGIPLLDHHPGIGGRFSALTNVGLLAAIARGLDSRARARRRQARGRCPDGGEAAGRFCACARCRGGDRAGARARHPRCRS